MLNSVLPTEGKMLLSPIGVTAAVVFPKCRGLSIK